VGSFPNPWQDPAKELDQYNRKKWFPNTPDFLVVAGKGSIQITSASDFLLKILSFKGSISRLNFFSHGNVNMVGMAGKTLVDGSDVGIGPNPEDKWEAVTHKSLAILDPYSTSWGNFGENSSNSVKVGTTRASLDAVRAKFASDAQIWVYACHTGANSFLLQQIANTFQVTVNGFSGAITYCPPSNFPTSRNHKIYVNDSPPPDPCANIAEADFHNVAKGRSGIVRTIKPKMPTP
jgi:hypothetical protein